MSPPISARQLAKRSLDSQLSLPRAIAFEIPQIAGFPQHFER
jgi:hypothetical protein